MANFNSSEVTIAPDPESIAGIISLKIEEILKEAIGDHGFASLVLAGGSSFKHTYNLLSKNKNINWEKIHIFFGDERAVAADDERSNYIMAKQNLGEVLSKSRDYRIKGELGANIAAKKYEQEILDFGHGRMPIFDLVLLGAGADGHTASIFPGQLEELLMTEKLVINTKAELDPFVERVTMTPKLLNHAANIIVVVSGKQKRDVAKSVIESKSLFPINFISPEEGKIFYYFDSQAAGEST